MLLVLKYIWTSPNTLIGLLLAIISLPGSTSAKWNDGIFELTGGCIGKAISHWPLSASAITIGHVIIANDEGLLILSRRHELIHVKQFEVWGPIMIPAYMVASVIAIICGKHPYKENYFEKQASR